MKLNLKLKNFKMPSKKVLIISGAILIIVISVLVALYFFLLRPLDYNIYKAAYDKTAALSSFETDIYAEYFATDGSQTTKTTTDINCLVEKKDGKTNFVNTIDDLVNANVRHYLQFNYNDQTYISANNLGTKKPTFSRLSSVLYQYLDVGYVFRLEYIPQDAIKAMMKIETSEGSLIRIKMDPEKNKDGAERALKSYYAFYDLPQITLDMLPYTITNYDLTLTVKDGYIIRQIVSFTASFKANNFITTITEMEGNIMTDYKNPGEPVAIPKIEVDEELPFELLAYGSGVPYKN